MAFLRKMFRIKTRLKDKFSQVKPFNRLKKDESGQTFLEFIFLLLIMVLLSFGLVNGFNSSLAKQWSALVKAISLPNSDNSFEL